MNDNFIPLSVPSLRGNELNYVKECIDTEWISSAGSYVDKFAEHHNISTDEAKQLIQAGKEEHEKEAKIKRGY